MTALGALFAAATLLATVRVIARRHGQAAWRLGLLLTLQAAAAAFLFLALRPGGSAVRGTLTVLTAGTAGLAQPGAVVLPESRAVGGERAPDLATALRQRRPARLRVIGDGLTPRDRDAVGTMAVTFRPPRPRPGLTALTVPATVAAGAGFVVAGEADGARTVALRDPAGRLIDRSVPDGAGHFVLHGRAGVTGPADFALQVGAAAPVALPLWTVATPPRRVLLLAGAASPEVKFLRRWADDAGIDLDVHVDAGDGLTLGSAVPLTAAALARDDVAIVDERSLAALPAATRAALFGAVRAGLGLVVRLTAPPPPAARTALAAVGFAVGDAPAAVTLAAAEPVLTGWPATGRDAVPLVRDRRGGVVSAWRAAGLGRIALSPLADSYRLVLAGHSDRFAALWSRTLTAVARATPGPVPTISAPAWVGERTAICGLDGPAAVDDPAGQRTRLIIDPASGAAACAGYWPAVAGWHRLVVAGRPVRPFAVAAVDQWPGLRARRDTAATLALAGAIYDPRAAPAAAAGVPRWVWAAAWLAVGSGLWWLERSRCGRR